MLDKIEGFDWDGANVGHILRHAVTPFEVEEVVGRTHVIIQQVPFMARIVGSFLAERRPAAVWSSFSRSAGSCFAPSLPTK